MSDFEKMPIDEEEEIAEEDTTCPEKICDGSGILFDGRKCLCSTDEEYKEVY